MNFFGIMIPCHRCLYLIFQKMLKCQIVYKHFLATYSKYRIKSTAGRRKQYHFSIMVDCFIDRTQYIFGIVIQNRCLLRCSPRYGGTKRF